MLVKDQSDYCAARQRRQLSQRDLKRLQKLAPPRGYTSQRLFRELGNDGVISYTEYLFLMHVLTKTDRSLRVAFQVLDTDGNGCIDKKELLFVSPLSLSISNKLTNLRSGVKRIATNVAGALDQRREANGSCAS